MRVVIGEDQLLSREGLALVLERAGFETVASAADGEDLVRKALAHRPDLVITDIRMPPRHADDGLLDALGIRARRPGTPVLVLSQHVQRRYALELLADDAGGVGYLLKQRVADVGAFLDAVRSVAAGGTVIDPEVVALSLDRSTSHDAQLEALTTRQREVLELMAQGLSNAAIARRLVVSEKAVVQHCSNIYGALDLTARPDDHRRVLAVLRYLAE